jgi:hypothetical protein
MCEPVVPVHSTSTYVKIPPEVRIIVIQARDKKFGYGGRVVEVTLPGR